MCIRDRFNSDFRGFLFSDEQPGVRLFGNLRSNRINYNLAYFYLLEKNTNSELNTFQPRHQQVYIGNVYIQDFLAKGYTTEFSFHYNRDDPTIHFDDNGFLVRPAPIGAVVNDGVLTQDVYKRQDYCYDKRLYDRLVEGSTERMREHLVAPVGYQRCLIRFLENHDEPRAAAVFSAPRNRVAAVALMTLPGAKLLHEGQSAGAKIRLSAHLGRRPEESLDDELRAFYQNLVEVVRAVDLRNGVWQLCQQGGWSDDQSCHNLISWCWQVAGRKYLVVLNLSDWRSQGQIIPPWNDLGGRDWHLRNLLPVQDYGRRSGDEMSAGGLYVELDSHSFHFLELVPLEACFVWEKPTFPRKSL